MTDEERAFERSELIRDALVEQVLADPAWPYHVGETRLVDRLGDARALAHELSVMLSRLLSNSLVWAVLEVQDRQLLWNYHDFVVAAHYVTCEVEGRHHRKSTGGGEHVESH